MKEGPVACAFPVYFQEQFLKPQILGNAIWGIRKWNVITILTFEKHLFSAKCGALLLKHSDSYPSIQNGSSCKTFHMEISLIFLKMNLKVEHIFMWIVSHEDTFSHKGKRKWPVVLSVAVIVKRKTKGLQMRVIL